MNRFTLIIHNKGWTVTDACDHWAIRYATYNARCNNPKMFNQLECMCNGLESKADQDWEYQRNGNIVGKSRILYFQPDGSMKEDKLK